MDVRIHFLSSTLVLAICSVLSTPVQAAIVITNPTSIQFGNYVYNGTACTIRVNEATGTRTVSAGSAVLLSSGTAARRAIFKVTGGTPNQLVTITIPTSVIITATGGPNMTFTPALNGATVRNLSATGTLTFEIGGTASLPSAATASVLYTANYSVSVN